MSLLEKATRSPKKSSSQSRSSLFTKALASLEPARAEPPGPLASIDYDGLQREIGTLPQGPDSMLALWSLVTERLPLSALALFLPRGDFLELAAQNGFPEAPQAGLSSRCVDLGIPPSLALSSRSPGSALGAEAVAIVSPILGLASTIDVRGASMNSFGGLHGLWVYHDPLLAAMSETECGRLGSFLARAPEGLPALSLAPATPDPSKALLAASRKYLSASVLAFDFSSMTEAPALKGLRPLALASAVFATSSRILSQAGAAFCDSCGRFSCVLGSASTADPELALFQFSKTLKRALPSLAAFGLPAGRALFLDPAAENCLEEIRAFLQP